MWVNVYEISEFIQRLGMISDKVVLTIEDYFNTDNLKVVDLCREENIVKIKCNSEEFLSHLMINNCDKNNVERGLRGVVRGRVPINFMSVEEVYKVVKIEIDDYVLRDLTLNYLNLMKMKI